MLLLELTDVVMQEAYIISLLISFVYKLKGLTDIKCELVFPLSLCRNVEL